MNVLFHTDALAKPDQFGLARYAKCLLQDAAFLSAVTPNFFSLQNDARNVLPAALDFDVEESQINVPGLSRRLCQILWAVNQGPDVSQYFPEADLVHTLELDYPISVKDKPWVTTIHDIGPLTHPDYFSKSRPLLRRMGLLQAARSAERIICVSQATANEVQGYLNRDLGEQLVVVHEGVEEEYFIPPDMTVLDSLIELPDKERPFLFWAGTVNPRKNIDGLLKAFLAVEERIEHDLVIAGNVGWDADDLLKQISTNERLKNRVHLLGFVSDEQLRALYHRASAFVYISRMEGFGLPILEAMACGCPVITSNISSMPEVAGQAAILVDPDNVDSIAGGIECLMSDTELRNSLIVKGRQRAREMSWSRCAAGVLDVYRTALEAR